MQYKIPVQIENEDPIIGNISLRQIIIMMGWGAIWYSVFKTLEPQITGWPAAMVAIPIILTGVIIALLKVSEMTFLPAALNFIRLQLTSRERVWEKWVDSYMPIEIWYVNEMKQVLGKNLSKGSIHEVLSDETQEKFSKI